MSSSGGKSETGNYPGSDHHQHIPESIDSNRSDKPGARLMKEDRRADEGAKHKRKDRDGQKGDISDDGLPRPGGLSRNQAPPLQEINVVDEAVSVEDAGGRAARKTPRPDTEHPPRLLLVSSKIKSIVAMQTALLPTVTLVQYKYESATLDGILALLAQQLGSKKVESIAMVMHGNTNSIYISAKDDKVLTKENILELSSLRDFFKTLVANHLDRSYVNARLDFLASNTTHTVDGGIIAQEISQTVGIPTGISKDITGSDIPMERIGEDKHTYSCVGDLYFRLDKLKNWSGNNQQTLAGFEKIRTVGKGAYGTAVLYRKKDDDSLVILKEINLHDLTAGERQMSLNEVKVLAMLDHPNIISYYDSFEEDGIVMIEMEYADGGTLAQFLHSQQDKPMEERQILATFQQMVAAIRHIHEHNILHRDLKTANIFMTKEGVVKVGDFGISKLMSTANNANTVLGTPYYISPEMCEGKPYNDKSDIWALGCILYEMACLQKTFEGSNLPALVNKIMKGQFAPVKGSYSQEFKNLIRDMLQREPEYRPSAAELWHSKLPELMSRYEEPGTDYEDDAVGSSENPSGRKRKTRSVLYYFEMCNMSLHPIELPSKVKIRDVAVGKDHVIVVTIERMVYSWGEGAKGQLGHGSLESKAKPELIEALKGKSILRASCGENFSLFGSDNGIVMTCGDGTMGCLGHGDWCSTSRPRLIEALLSVDVITIAAGPQHVVVVGSDGEVFTWGCGVDGRLGLGDEENYNQPMEVGFSDPVYVRDARCGQDGTMLITDVGSVLACGNNENNKLGLNQRQGFLMAMKNIFNKTEVEGQKIFTLVKALARHRVLDIAMGPHNSAVVVEPGHIYTFGKNTEGQLGTGNLKVQNAPIEIKMFEEKPAFRIQCGEYYSVAGTTDNDLLFWGTRFKTPPKPDDSFSWSKTWGEMRVVSATSTHTHSRPNSNASMSSVKENNEIHSAKEEPSSQPLTESVKTLPPRPPTGGTERQISSDSMLSSSMGPSAGLSSTGGFRPLSSTVQRRTPSASSKEKDRESTAKDDTELILQPTPLLRMDSSGSHSPAGETVTLSNFFCHGENLFIEVETTAPPPKRKSRRKKYYRKRLSNNALEVPGSEGQMRMSASSRDGGDEYSSETSEFDTYGTIPAWIKHELANSEVEPGDGGDAGDTSEHSDDESATANMESSMSSIQINKDFKNTPPRKEPPKSRSPRTKIDTEKSGGGVEKKEGQKSSSQESGVDFTPVEPLSSSSSSETMVNSLTSNKPDSRSKSPNASVGKKSASTLPRKVTGPMPYKSKLGPAQAQKPLNRLRAQTKVRTRSSDPGKEGSIKSSASEQELERLRLEKKKSEDRIRKMEEEYKKQQEKLKEQAAKEAAEREAQLQKEIEHLKAEMHNQSHQLKDNYNVVLTLQSQLEKIESEQARISAREQRSQSQQSVKSVNKSSICSLQ